MSPNPSPGKVKIGLIQMSSTDQVADNMTQANDLIRQAAGQGAQMVLTPEMTPLLDWDRGSLLEKIYPQAQDPNLKAFQALAQELNIWLVIGSMAIQLTDKIANRCFVISPDGALATQYDKIHMFDVDLPDGDSYRESRSYAAGDQAVVATTPWGPLGLSICYDVRFPGLYRKLAQGGAAMLSVPAAFTAVTGKAHWHILLRARAIENGAFVFAPAQTGTHDTKSGQRQTFGHSLIINPWGEILVDGGTDVGVVVGEIDLAQVAEARSRIPSLTHDQVF